MNELQYRDAINDMLENIHKVSFLKRIYNLTKYFYIREAD